MHDPRSEKCKELADKCRVRRPCGRSNQVAVCDGGIDGDVGIFAVRKYNLCAAGRIGGAGAPLKHPRCGKQLGSVAKGADGLPRTEEMLHSLDHLLIQAKIFRRPSSRYDEPIIGL